MIYQRCIATTRTPVDMRMRSKLTISRYICNERCELQRCISLQTGQNVFYKNDVQIGNGFYFKSHDLVGIAFSWAQPNIPGSKDQLTAELFYRAQITPHLAITPDLQWIYNPTLNPDVTNLWYFGVRGRITLQVKLLW